MVSRRGAGGEVGGAGGFTLVEAIGAILVLSVAVPALLLSAGEAQGGRASAALACRARWLATEKLEEVIADRHSSVRGYGYVSELNYPDEPSVRGFSKFARAVSVVQTGPDLRTPGTGFSVVMVTVSWTDGRGRARSLELSTVLTNFAR